MRDTLSCRRRLAVAGITTLFVLAIAVSASAQTGGSGPPGRPTTNTPTTTTPAPVGPPGKATIRKDGTAVAPADAPAQIQTAIAAANAIHTLPYVWGGGHRSFFASGYDCSGAVSYVPHAAGLLATDDPGGPQRAGCSRRAAGSRYGNASHAHMVIAGSASTPPPAVTAGTRAQAPAGGSRSASRWASPASTTPASRPKRRSREVQASRQRLARLA